MCIDFESIVILAGTYWMLYLAFTTTPSVCAVDEVDFWESVKRHDIS